MSLNIYGLRRKFERIEASGNADSLNKIETFLSMDNVPQGGVTLLVFNSSGSGSQIIPIEDHEYEMLVDVFYLMGKSIGRSPNKRCNDIYEKYFVINSPYCKVPVDRDTILNGGVYLLHSMYNRIPVELNIKF